MPPLIWTFMVGGGKLVLTVMFTFGDVIVVVETCIDGPLMFMCMFGFMFIWTFIEGGGGTFIWTFIEGGGTFICMFIPIPPTDTPSPPSETVKFFMGMTVGAQLSGALKL